MERRVTILIATLALAIGACGGGASESAAGVSAGDGWVAILSLVPDTPDNRDFVMMEDIAAVREQLGLAVPVEGADEQALRDYMMTLSQGPVIDDSTIPKTRSPGVFLGVFAHGLGSTAPDLLDIPAWRAEMGMAVVDLDADLLTGRFPDVLQIWLGAIDHATVEGAVNIDPLWSGDLRNLDHAGIGHWCWGDDPLEPRLDRISPTTRPLGQGGCLAAFDGAAYRTLTEEAMQAALETRAGQQPSLADVDELRLAADALEDAGTYAITLTMERDRYSSESPRINTAGLDQPFLDEWLAMGAGAGFDDAGEYLVVVLVYGDEATAVANAAVLETIARTGDSLAFARGRAWSDTYDTLRSVHSNGRVVIGIFQGFGIAHFWHGVTGLPDTLVIWD